MRRKLITPPVLEQRPPKSGRIEVRDSLSPLILRITAQGSRSFVVRTRVRGQKQPIRLTYDRPAHISILEDARAWAVAAAGQCRRGIDPRPERDAQAASEKALTEKRERNKFSTVADNFLAMHASKNRSYSETERIIDFYVRPAWKDRQIGDIGREDVVALLDRIEVRKFEGADGKLYGGPVMADRVLAQVRKLMNWHATRDAKYVSPIVKGMARTKPKDRARKRVLSDDEIRLIWPVLGRLGVFGALVQMLFLTAQRRSEVGQMRRSQVGGDGIWAIPAENYKTNRPQFVPLSHAALKVFKAQKQIDDSDIVFTSDGKHEFQNCGHAKADLDARVARRLRALARARGQDASKVEPLPGWTLHDIRRTARSLMSRGDIRPDIAERVLGHVIPGVAGTYDRHDYLDKKQHALETLADQLDRILNPGPTNVVSLLARSAAE